MGVRAVRERYSLHPHEKREIAKLAGKKVDRKALRGLATRYGVSLKVVHEVLVHHNVEIDADQPVSPKKPKKPKLFLKKPAPHSDAPEESPEDDLIKRKLHLDRREAELDRREAHLLERERKLEQDRQDADLVLRHADESPAPEEIERRDREISQLRNRLEQISNGLRKEGVPSVRLYSAATVGQIIAAKNAEIARLKQQVDHARSDHLPESMQVM